MKKEDIYNGITEIRDDLIEGAAKKRKRPKIWRFLVAAGLAAVIALGGFAVWRQWDISGTGGADPDHPAYEDPTGNGTHQTPAPVRTLAEAAYPERPAYPQEGWGEEYDLWYENMCERGLTGAELSAMTGWNTAAVRTMLSGHGDGNVVCSPTNLYLALSMLSEITGGETRAQILEALGVDSVEVLRAQANRLWNALYNDDGTYSLTLANSLWLQNRWEYRQEPLDILSEDYYASSFSGEMGSEEYDAVLREWIHQNTGNFLSDKTRDLGFDMETVIALASTLYFADKWELPFDEALTAPEMFHAPGGDVERDCLHGTIESYVVRGDKFTAVELKFETGGSMRLLLPKEGVEPEELLSDPAALRLLSGGEFTGAELMDVTLSLPKFDVSFDGDIRESMVKMGITDALDRDRSDFSPVSATPLVVTHVFHASRVKIDEEGCEAAAYTLITSAPTTGLPWDNEDIELTFDRPFLFAVISQSQPIFAGIVNEP